MRKRKIENVFYNMMSVKTLLEKTKDGSHTLFVPELNEHYHSVNGAVQESRHVFIEAGLHACKKEEIRVFEVGFGTGLNALLACFEVGQSIKKIDYASIELFPISIQLANSLNYPAIFEDGQKSIFKNMHLCKWNQRVNISEQFSLTKIQADISDYAFADAQRFDVVFFDAFAPEKQPDLWNRQVFQKMFDALVPEGILVTYCAKGAVRRMLQACGFAVERLPGPPGKREMLRARRPGSKV